jgi:hypothetical protein
MAVSWEWELVLQPKLALSGAVWQLCALFRTYQDYDDY